MIENFIESSKYAQNLFKIKNKIIQDIKNKSLDENVPIITDEVLNYMKFVMEKLWKISRNLDYSKRIR